MRQLRRDQTATVRAGCLLAFGLMFTVMSIAWLGIAWLVGAPLMFLLFDLPFLAAGLGMLGWGIWRLLLRPRLVGRTLGPAVIALTPEEVRVGERFTLQVRQPVRRETEIGGFSAQLILREIAVYRRGTNTYTVTHDNLMSEYTSPRRRLYQNDELAEDCAFQIPPDGMHSFGAPRNTLRWLIRVRVDIPGSPDMVEEVVLNVRPEHVEGERRGDAV